MQKKIRSKLAHQELIYLFISEVSFLKKTPKLHVDDLIDKNNTKQQSETVHSEQNTSLKLKLTVKNQMTGICTFIITADACD